MAAAAGGCSGKIDARTHTADAGTRADGPLEDTMEPASTVQPPVVDLPDPVTVVFTEIMYHPVLENADVENHEFVEIYNRSKAPVALEGWRLASDGKGIAFTFPAKTIAPGQYVVIAKNRQMLAAVPSYGLKVDDVLGDYDGELADGGAILRLIDGAGNLMDAVKYNDKRPWPLSPDELGVGEDWLPADQLPLTKHQYRGRSLERISTDHASNTAANWEASPLDGATPGKASSVAGKVMPIVEVVGASPEGGTGEIIRKDQNVVITACFSDITSTTNVTGVSDVMLEYFVDDVAQTSTTPLPPVPMVLGADGAYRAMLPPQPDSSVVKYRIKATRGAQTGVVAPRASDPLEWLGYFVTPIVYVKTGVETKERVYHLFVKPGQWTNLERWVALGRETGDTRCGVNKNWDTSVPANFVHDGKVYDVRVRYTGSRYQRGNGGIIANWPYPGPTITRSKDPKPGMANTLRALSWRVKFPKYDRFTGKRGALNFNKLWQGCPGTVSYVESKLLEKAGLPGYLEEYGRLHVNGGYFHYAMMPEDIDDMFLQRVFPDEAVIGDLFKDDGGVSNFGPAGRGDFLPLTVNDQCPMQYTVMDRYVYTYPRQNYEYRPYDELIKLMTDLAAARKVGPKAVRDYFMQYWDWQGLLTTFVIRNWAGVWDDTAHNIFPYKRPSTGKWIAIQQDFEWDFGLGRFATGPGLGPFDPNETIYIGWNSPNPVISVQCELPEMSREAQNCNALGFNALKDAFMDVFKTEFEDKMRELTKEPAGLLTTASVSKIIDEAVGKFSVDDWLADPSLKMCNAESSHSQMYIWTRQRNAAVARKLAHTAADAGVDPLVRPDAGQPGNGGMAIDWTRCQGGDQPGVSASDFCTTYEKTCGFVTDAGGANYLNRSDCLAKYGKSRQQGCLAGQLCYAFNYAGSNSYCDGAAGFENCDY